ncbi:MAG: aminotransferase class III-fold pyridoxal phosphate-dependent enzyme [Candidatus Alcyoniella australis]|nr:aminotransferase class III-fold pyridoxal phosphate-dependent enzyme [Candidatus Alcyoniella australis]
MSARTDRQRLLKGWAEVFGPAQVESLKALGHDLFEGARGGSHVASSHGARYIDCVSGAGAYNLGRRHPALVAAVREAMAQTDQGNFPMISEEKGKLAQALAQFAPGDLECSMFSVMRGEAFDFACKLARGFTGRPGLVAPQGSCFGQTGFALALSAREDADDFAPAMPQCATFTWGDLEAAKRAIDERTAALLIEPIQVENGCREADAEQLRELQRICRSRGALFVIDETQSGFGRCGARFAFEEAGLEPDVLIVGEALGGGLFPIAATLFTQRVNSFMNDHPLIHLSTFGGSDLGCLVARRALEIYQAQQPWHNARAMGDRLRTACEELAAKHGNKLHKVQGSGLLISLCLSSKARARKLCKLLAVHGVLSLPAEVDRRCVLLRPSLLLSTLDADDIQSAVAAALETL